MHWDSDVGRYYQARRRFLWNCNATNTLYPHSRVMIPSRCLLTSSPYNCSRLAIPSYQLRAHLLFLCFSSVANQSLLQRYVYTRTTGFLLRPVIKHARLPSHPHGQGFMQGHPSKTSWQNTSVADVDRRSEAASTSRISQQADGQMGHPHQGRRKTPRTLYHEPVPAHQNKAFSLD